MQDVGEIGAAPRVDGLPVVADGADVLFRANEQFDDLVLHVVGVLVFVDEDLPEAGLPLLAQGGKILQELQFLKE